MPQSGDACHQLHPVVCCRRFAPILSAIRHCFFPGSSDHCLGNICHRFLSGGSCHDLGGIRCQVRPGRVVMDLAADMLLLEAEQERQPSALQRLWHWVQEKRMERKLRATAYERNMKPTTRMPVSRLPTCCAPGLCSDPPREGVGGSDSQGGGHGSEAKVWVLTLLFFGNIFRRPNFRGSPPQTQMGKRVLLGSPLDILPYQQPTHQVTHCGTHHRDSRFVVITKSRKYDEPGDFFSWA